MNDTSENPAIAPPPTLTALDPRQKHVIRIHAMLMGLVPLIALCVADFVLSQNFEWFEYGILTGLAVFLYALSVMFLPWRRYSRWGYHMARDAIRIASGIWIRNETVVPFARVQHIDVSRGPLERMFGVATLTLHTAGSYNSTVALPGLASDDADAMRETIREHIRQDVP